MGRSVFQALQYARPSMAGGADGSGSVVAQSYCSTPMATVAAEVETRVCKVCHQVLALDLFVKAKGGSGRLFTCRACRRRQRREAHHRQVAAGIELSSSCKRQALSDRRTRLGWREFAAAPNPAPARDLAELLAYDRAYGLSFEESWGEDVEWVLERIAGQGSIIDREEWAEAFTWAKPFFAAGYSGQPVPGGLSPTMLDVLSESRRRDEQPV